MVGVALGYRYHGFYRMAIHIQAILASSKYRIAASSSCLMVISTVRFQIFLPVNPIVLFPFSEGPA
ncbi:MAG: hypothetical protein Q8M67_04345, partial [Bacteroidota bacterium]|nr:hypothetical protein [Bacteroidota bacterium]